MENDLEPRSSRPREATPTEPIIVYPGMPVDVDDGCGNLVYSVVIATGNGDACPDPTPYFYVDGLAGHWHLGQHGVRWKSRRDDVGSPESVLANRIVGSVTNVEGARQLARMAIEYCVSVTGCSVQWPANLGAGPVKFGFAPSRTRADGPGKGGLKEIDDLLARLRAAVHELGGDES